MTSRSTTRSYAWTKSTHEMCFLCFPSRCTSICCNCMQTFSARHAPACCSRHRNVWRLNARGRTQSNFDHSGPCGRPTERIFVPQFRIIRSPNFGLSYVCPSIVKTTPPPAGRVTFGVVQLGTSHAFECAVPPHFGLHARLGGIHRAGGAKAIHMQMLSCTSAYSIVERRPVKKRNASSRPKN